MSSPIQHQSESDDDEEGSSNSAKPEADEVGEAKWRISGRRRVVEGEESLKTLLLLLLFYYR